MLERGVDRAGLPVFERVIAVVLALGFGSRGFRRDRSRVVEQRAAGHLEELVELGDPVLHRHRSALQRLQLRILDVQVHDAMKDLQPWFGEVVLGDRSVRFADDATRAGRIEVVMLDLA